MVDRRHSRLEKKAHGCSDSNLLLSLRHCARPVSFYSLNSTTAEVRCFEMTSMHTAREQRGGVGC